jgi:hypothetical protein
VWAWLAQCMLQACGSDVSIGACCASCKHCLAWHVMCDFLNQRDVWSGGGAWGGPVLCRCVAKLGTPTWRRSFVHQHSLPAGPAAAARRRCRCNPQLQCLAYMHYIVGCFRSNWRVLRRLAYAVHSTVQAIPCTRDVVGMDQGNCILSLFALNGLLLVVTCRRQWPLPRVSVRTDHTSGLPTNDDAIQGFDHMLHVNGGSYAILPRRVTVFVVCLERQGWGQVTPP